MLNSANTHTHLRLLLHQFFQSTKIIILALIFHLNFLYQPRSFSNKHPKIVRAPLPFIIMQHKYKTDPGVKISKAFTWEITCAVNYYSQFFTSLIVSWWDKCWLLIEERNKSKKPFVFPSIFFHGESSPQGLLCTYYLFGPPHRQT